ncbi:Putative regulator containing a HipA-like domain [Mycoavidus cysteinexigens]|uniref:Regulator containing a HipA-like domain n=1 Tax=Mycoavidus cysteinexigens TaxID=1553431 RepID=A0A2Z6EU64_9BURK|nr:type II toxin-antitoxin system HipA family toxin [Mycoavidus cysteinexigens]BBE08989.1 Putative regulator containing a HipA-like domain [Mycoavidus cysteinexigens]GAM52283.1 possible HipA protein [bacterium endosymbiont of Mortierella elongata FMR23-6]GLR01166.1 kinase [Mycoavidus cysteinexigens]
MKFLAVYLNQIRVGFLSQIGDIYQFLADDAYLSEPHRPTLSLAYNVFGNDALTRQLFTEPATVLTRGLGRLPPFFDNLLPEGPLREWLAAERHTTLNDGLELLAAAGNNLPGAVIMRAEWPAESIKLKHNVNQKSAFGPQAIEAPLADAFSLAGVQFKLALSALDGNLRYTMHLEQGLDGEPIIGKFPSAQRNDMVYTEFSGMALTRMAGIETADCWLAPISALDERVQAPARTSSAQEFLAVRRFDRTPEGQRIHIEDFCQVLSLAPERKYGKRTDYETLAAVLLHAAVHGERQVAAYIRRQVVNTLLGNTDAHLKNFSLIYRDGRTPELAPAYDQVPVFLYFDETPFLAVNKKIDQILSAQTLKTYRELYKLLGLSTVLAAQIVKDTIERCLALWPEEMRHLPLTVEQRRKIEYRINHLPLVREVLRRR